MYDDLLDRFIMDLGHIWDGPRRPQAMGDGSDHIKSFPKCCDILCHNPTDK